MKHTLTALLVFFSITALHAGDRQLMPYPENEKIFVYPDKGQSDEQVQDDKFQCYQEAMKLTGFDPSSIPQGENAPPGISVNHLKHQQALVEILERLIKDTLQGKQKKNGKQTK